MERVGISFLSQISTTNIYPLRGGSGFAAPPERVYVFHKYLRHKRCTHSFHFLLWVGISFSFIFSTKRCTHSAASRSINFEFTGMLEWVWVEDFSSWMHNGNPFNNATLAHKGMISGFHDWLRPSRDHSRPCSRNWAFLVANGSKRGRSRIPKQVVFQQTFLSQQDHN